jgi:mannose-1-phosphate guanylyltransferase
MPKQFVKLFDDKSLFQLTIERNSKVCKGQFVVSNAEQFFLAQDQLEELGEVENSYLLEPLARNTAPAIALACLALEKDEMVLVTPSDHLIKDEKEYQKVLKRAQELAEQGSLVTFGIEPTTPETGYGYIEASGEDVVSFKEKPDLAKAKEYLEAGNYYWNSGMFCFKAGVFLEELKLHSPKIYEMSLKAYERAKKDGVIRISHEDMASIPEDSIDYAVMERSKKVKVVASDIKWSDLGSFDSLYDELPKDENGNSQNKNHIAIGSKNNLVFGDDRKIATIDIENLIIVDSGDALLVSHMNSSQKVKEVVKEIKSSGSELHNIHLTGHRPWGTYTVLEDSKGYKIKRIEVKPGKRLSLQKHFHRSEHWIVVSGSATVTIGEKTTLVRPNESTYIKAGEIHRLANEGKIPVVLIEAQVGEYTGEDDIVRIEDDYKRMVDE